MALKCAKTSALPSSGAMKPKPFSALNHLTVPVAILLSFCPMGTADASPMRSTVDRGPGSGLPPGLGARGGCALRHPPSRIGSCHADRSASGQSGGGTGERPLDGGIVEHTLSGVAQVHTVRDRIVTREDAISPSAAGDMRRMPASSKEAQGRIGE